MKLFMIALFLKKLKEFASIILVLLITVLFANCKDPIIEDIPSPDSGDSTHIEVSKMDWWNDARYGMFIHYGMYSVLGGEYIGKNVDGTSVHFQSLGRRNSRNDTIKIGDRTGAEWILYDVPIPKESYYQYAPAFTAEKYNPQAIVSLAQNAGMKYIIFTVKQHDGFCLWDSKVTNWDVASTPAGIRWNNDLIAPLVQAARMAGLKIGFYFSHVRDWIHPGAVGPIPELHMKEYSFEENQKYMETYTYPMITELLNRYHPDIFWWDSQNPYEEFAKRCNSLVADSDPNIIQDDRVCLSSAYPGDFATREQTMEEDEEYENVELCMTMNCSWGFNQFDDEWKEPEYILWSLLRVNKLGGNYLLNMGLQGDGDIPKESQVILEKVGQWIKMNKDGVYGTRKSPLQFNLPYGPTTWHNIKGDWHLYYHIFYWDGTGELWLPGIMNKADEVELSFSANHKLNFHTEAVDGIGLHITGLPRNRFTDMCTMLDIKFKSKPYLEEGSREINRVIHLDALAAQIGDVAIDDYETKPSISWYLGRRIRYKVRIAEEGTYKISALLAGFYSGTITFDFGNGLILTGNNHSTPGGHINFEWQNMGSVSLTKGIYILNITGQQTASWIKLRGFKLERQ